MKRLFLIGGPMGVGKSAVCEQLVKRLQPGVYLDGDWCWHMRPFSVTDATKAMVMDNICALLGRWVENGEYPDDLETVGNLVADISYRNARRYFDL